MKEKIAAAAASAIVSTLLAIMLALAHGAEGTIGVNYGTVANNLPPPEQVAQFLLDSTIINRVRLFDANPDALQAFAHTGIAISVTVANDQIPSLTNLSFAQQWVKSNVSPFIRATNIVRILVGNEVLSTANKLLIMSLVPAMQAVHTALVGESLDRRIQARYASGGISHEGNFLEGDENYLDRPLRNCLGPLRMMEGWLSFRSRASLLRSGTPPLAISRIFFSGDQGLLFSDQRLLLWPFLASSFPEVSTPHSLGVLSTSTPPSTGKFWKGYDTHVLKPLLSFLKATNSPFMVNPYPFFGCSAETLDFALFRPNSGVFDENTGLNYTNMLDAQLDAVFSAMKLMGYDDVDIVIAETGWPSAGDDGEVGVDPDSAAAYNAHLIQHVVSGVGTPMMPNRTFETYIFALFNEDLKPGPTCERHFGLFEPDLTPAYDVGILRPTASNFHSSPRDPAARHPRTAGKLWCLPREGAGEEALQRNIDYVCGSGLDCRPIQAGGRCFAPNTVRAHAAYAMNLYFQSTGRHDYDCDFGQTGAISTVDPSTLCY
ncbi:hypothetical protein Nepgr_029932 [Nepenthes gracilis]|uniref:X8 domain-containing protein n=1 Tax=Nepenthes gracilis TaxID=150966 RepID=A0AAD3TF86_NEPGR|nr:hypothetical protein Nepgr_029932 [Nepenthes gracilis]